MHLDENELKESFTGSGGPGGQNVNKRDTAVILEHIPTGLTVRCEETRSRAQNRERARELLADKIREHFEAEKQAAIDKHEKERRRKRKRSKAAKEKMLDEKKKQSQKKQLRKPPKLPPEF